MFIKLLIIILFFVFNLYANEKKINEQELQNIIKEYILENPEIIIESIERFTANQRN